ncbi:MAG: gliding motility-associated C-terminal domain-containing protein [Bacteroidales bacterium]|nr:gliding motility-associated C-terminal domain-containing protein [Bacteroidales bacterium]
MKKILAFILLLLPFAGLMAQNYIIMGSSAAYTSIGEDPMYFYDPGGTAAHQGDNGHPQGYFATNLSDTMKLKTNVTGTQLYISFTTFSMGVGDTLYIYDGEDVTAPLLGVYNLVNDPGEILASGRSLTFVFHSDDINDYAELSEGWVAQVYAYVTNPNNCLMSTGMTYMTCNAKFYDEGGPSGNMQSTSGTSWCEFTSPVGSHIEMVFTQFSVNGIMKIYDGQYYDANKRLIGKFCTSTSQPPHIISSGATICIEYVAASGDQNKAGWAADVSCIAELFEAPDGSACPSIDITAADTSVSFVEFDCDNPTTILTANIVATGPYSFDYTVQEIPYNPPFAFNAGTSIGASTDDNWVTNGVTLPFHFSFFGITYQTAYPGCNGLISFNSHSHMSSCSWSTTNCPTSSNNPPYGSTPYIYPNSVYGVYEDIYPGHYISGGDIKYDVMGSSPCRAFVFNYDNVGLYSCYTQGNNMYNSYQMVLYEGTNIIDIYIRHRACCSSWNQGNGVLGIQNNNSAQILIAPGRDFASVQGQNWTADNEGWRFTPITPLDPDGTITWYENSVHPDSIVGHNFRHVVSPQATTSYIAVYHYTNAGGDSFDLMDTVVVHVSIPPLTATNTTNGNICPNDEVTLNVTADNSYYGISATGYEWSCGDTTQSCQVAPEVSTTYQVTVTFDNGCKNYATTSVVVTELAFPEITATKDTICVGTSSTLTATHPDAESMQWNTGETSPTITVSPDVTTEYVISATMNGGCVTTDTFTLAVMPLPIPAFTASPTDIYVENGIGTVYCNSLTPEGNHLIWNFGDLSAMDNVVEDVVDPTHDYTRPGYYAITLTAIDSNGCVDSVKSRVQVTVPYFFYVPNAFSPNGDGINETWAPQGQGVDPENYKLLIYDRFGNVIYQTTNPYDYWDGRSKTGQRLPANVYVYYITFTTLNGDEKEYNGTITLIL